MGTISKDFSYREFEYSPTAERLKILNVIDTVQKRDSIKALVLKVLQPLRDLWGGELQINSGYRCERLNKAVGGVPTSQHTKGEAADINAANPYELAKLIRETPEIWKEVDQVILYPTFVHVSHKLAGQQRQQLLYNRRYNGKRL